MLFFFDFFGLSTCMSICLCCACCRHPSLYKALSSEEPVERRKASACLSRIGRAVTAVQASEKEREADSNDIKEAVKPLLRFQPEAGGGAVDDSKGACPSACFRRRRTYLRRFGIHVPEASRCAKIGCDPCFPSEEDSREVPQS